MYNPKFQLQCQYVVFLDSQVPEVVENLAPTSQIPFPVARSRFAVSH